MKIHRSEMTMDQQIDQQKQWIKIDQQRQWINKLVSNGNDPRRPAIVLVHFTDYDKDRSPIIGPRPSETTECRG